MTMKKVDDCLEASGIYSRITNAISAETKALENSDMDFFLAAEVMAVLKELSERVDSERVAILQEAQTDLDKAA